MSAIASFHVVPAARLSDIIAAAAPVQRGWFRRGRDEFRDALLSASRKIETFDGSGWVFNTLDLYLESRGGFMLGNFGDISASRQVSEARGSYWLVLPAAAAVELLRAVDRVECESADVTAFVASEHGADGCEEEAKAVQTALATLKGWLAEVSPDSVGLLSVA